MTIEKLEQNTPDIASQNVARLAELFPECVTEGPAGSASDRGEPVIDWDLLKQTLSDHLIEGPQERYRLDWPGKRAALLTANAPIDKTLRPMRADSVDFDTTRNLFIEGDNLDALKLLQETYLGKVKMIYIDPPYNTGSDFIYNDSFELNSAEFELASGQRDETSRLVANPDSNGRFHSDWLSMMLPRLKLARSLLTDDGLIFISIDDNQQSSLRAIMDELFGERNFVDQVVWKKRYGGGAKEKYFITLHEYVLVYCKSISSLANLEIPLTEESIKRYYKSKDANFDVRGPYRTHPLEATKSMGARPNLIYEIEGPGGVRIAPKRQWLWSRERTEEGLKNGEIEFVKERSGGWSVHTKQYLRDKNGTIRTGKPFSLIDDVFTQHGTNEIIEIMGDARIFPFPKPTAFLIKLLEIALTGRSKETIVDMFGGSASLAHALMEYNAGRSTSHALISVQLSELIDEDEEAFKAGYRTIADIGRERIRRAAAIIGKRGEGQTDLGYRAFRLDSGNFQDTRVAAHQASQDALAGMISHIKDDRTDEDLLFGALLRWGVDITLPVRKIELAGRTVWLVDPPADAPDQVRGDATGAALIACFARPQNGKGGIDKELADTMVALKPLRVLFRDDGFANDAAKENVASRFKQLAPDTDVKVL